MSENQDNFIAELLNIKKSLDNNKDLNKEDLKKLEKLFYDLLFLRTIDELVSENNKNTFEDDNFKEQVKTKFKNIIEELKKNPSTPNINENGYVINLVDKGKNSNKWAAKILNYDYSFNVEEIQELLTQKLPDGKTIKSLTDDNYLKELIEEISKQPQQPQQQGGKKSKKSSKTMKMKKDGKRKGNEWTKLVTKTYKANHKKDKEYTFKQAIQDARKMYKK